MAAEPNEVRPDGVAVTGRRAAAFTIDLVVVAALATLVLIPLHISLFALGVRHMGPSAVAVSALMLGALTWGYFTSLEALIGATMGKLAVGLRVVCADCGEKPSLRQASIRNAWRLLETVPLGVPALVAVRTSPSYQRIGDRRARTLVVAR